MEPLNTGVSDTGPGEGYTELPCVRDPAPPRHPRQRSRIHLLHSETHTVHEGAGTFLLYIVYSAYVYICPGL